jgi:hypothetical protein
MQSSEAAQKGGLASVNVTHPLPPSRTEEAKPAQLIPNPYSRLAIVAGILLPIATVPYLLARRRISGLQYKCKELEWKLNVLERRLSFNVSESSRVRAEQEKMLRDMMQEADDMQQQTMQRAAEQSQTNKMAQSDLHKLVEETKEIR